jgi:hypothetical protein
MTSIRDALADKRAEINRLHPLYFLYEVLNADYGEHYAVRDALLENPMPDDERIFAAFEEKLQELRADQAKRDEERDRISVNSGDQS